MLRFREASLIIQLVLFQSTLPVGGATRAVKDMKDAGLFQSTLPVGGATYSRRYRGSGKSDFNPRSPWGERPSKPQEEPVINLNFNPRSPWGERQRSNY